MLSTRPWCPPITQAIRLGYEWKDFHFMNQASANSKRLHGHEILQHSRRRIGRRVPSCSIENEKNPHADDPLLLIHNQRAARPDALHEGEGSFRDLLLAGEHAEACPL